MADNTAIEWTDRTWNPVRARRRLASGEVRTGWHCEHASPGCAHCYAERFNAWVGTQLAYKPGHRADIEIFLDEKLLLAPLRWRKPQSVFLSSMTDVFAWFVSDEMLDRMFAVMALCPHLDFQVLTKRSDRMRAYFERGADQARKAIYALANERKIDKIAGDRRLFEAINRLAKWPLPNAWLGVSVEDQARADERIPDLLATPAAVRFLSCEPLLSELDLTAIPFRHVPSGVVGRSNVLSSTMGPAIHWVIAGGESGPAARPMHPDWARALRDQCRAAGVPFFFKQWGEWLPWEPDHAPTWRSQAGGLIDGNCIPDMDTNEDPRAKRWSDDCFYDGVDICVHELVGKRAAGRLLDGRTHDEFPA